MWPISNYTRSDAQDLVRIVGSKSCKSENSGIIKVIFSGGVVYSLVLVSESMSQVIGRLTDWNFYL